MRLSDILSAALGNLLRRKLRSFLTMLGVVIGASAIIVTISLGYGAEKTQMEQLDAATNLRLISVNPMRGGYNSYDSTSGGRRVSEIKDRNIAEMRAIKGITAITPIVSAYMGQMEMSTGKFVNKDIWSVTGVLPADFIKINSLKSGHGFSGKSTHMEFIMSEMSMIYFSDPKAKNNKYIDVYSYLINGVELPLPAINWLTSPYKLSLSWYSENAFDNNDNPSPNITNVNARMVGTIAANINDWAYSSGPVVSLAWLKKFANENKELAKVTGLADTLSSYEYVEVLVDSIDCVLDVQKELRDYGVYASSPIEYLDEMKKQIQTMQNFLGFIGAISMLVAALSIANTMMMSIYERTREIGVMKVLGCKLGNIRMLFLAEAAYIGFFGGAIGLAFSYALSWALNNVVWLQEMVAQIMSSNFFGGAGGDVSIIPPELAMGAWALVVGVALCSGLYPAYRAMRLSSLAAIRNAD